MTLAPSTVADSLWTSRQHQFSRLLAPSQRNSLEAIFLPKIRETVVPRREKARNLNIYDAALEKQISRIEAAMSEREKQMLNIRNPAAFAEYLEYLAGMQQRAAPNVLPAEVGAPPRPGPDAVAGGSRRASTDSDDSIQANN